jgi:DNA-directed RNA polymerase subunit E"
MKQLYACKNCHCIINEKVCPHCAVPTSRRWQGYVIIEDPVQSQIAQKMNIKKPGKYALKVR